MTFVSVLWFALFGEYPAADAFSIWWWSYVDRALSGRDARPLISSWPISVRSFMTSFSCPCLSIHGRYRFEFISIFPDHLGGRYILVFAASLTVTILPSIPYIILTATQVVWMICSVSR
jgi:hypothetical protein